ncbi:unnamed protein product [Prorocentrum cordatum]|uniref:Mitochondrial carrier protein n=1 Tax=Prorocentrum cordatum TaxID=2364126 RepID=A0ABN9VHP8_9DINO|nr:unnamed protein product [Polarella glacialis]
MGAWDHRAFRGTVPTKREWIELPQNKGIQRVRQITERRVEALLDEMDLQRRTMQIMLDRGLDAYTRAVEGKQPGEGWKTLIKLIEDYEDMLRQAKRELQLQEALKERQAQLKALEREPEWFNYLAAFVAAVVSTLVVHPVDTIKTRLIAARDTEESGKGAEAEPTDLLGNVQDLYKGVVGNILKEGPSSALYLGVYETAKSRLLLTSLGSTPLAVYLLSGAVGEFCGSIVRAPMEAVKSRVQTGMDASTLESAQIVVGTEAGRSKVVAAWSASLWRDIPFGAVQLAVFETLKTFIVESPDVQLDVDSLPVEALLGAIGGVAGSFISVPFDVVTTRIITQNCPEGEERPRPSARWWAWSGRSRGCRASSRAGKSACCTGGPASASS